MMRCARKLVCGDLIDASSRSGLLSRKFSQDVEAGRHAELTLHKNKEGRWKHFVDQDGPALSRLHWELHDCRNGVS